MPPKKKYKGAMRGNEGSPSDKMYNASKSIYEMMQREGKRFIKRMNSSEIMSDQGRVLKSTEAFLRKTGVSRKNARPMAMKSAKRKNW